MSPQDRHGFTGPDTDRRDPAPGRRTADRERIRRGGLRGAELLAWLAAIPPAQRDSAVEELLGIAHFSPDDAPPGDELIGYIPSGVAPVVRAVFEAPITAEDVFIDLGAGLGKVAMIVHLLTGARARGIELQPRLVAEARARADHLGLDEVAFVAADARDTDLGDATVFFLYLPFTGAALSSVMQRLCAVAERQAIVVCALGLDFRGIDWLSQRETDAFWLSIYDSRFPGAKPRAARGPSPLGALAEAIALER